MIASRLLQQPITRAVGISVCLHGLLFALDPGVPSWYQADSDVPLAPIAVSLVPQRAAEPPQRQFPSVMTEVPATAAGTDLQAPPLEEPMRPGPLVSQPNPWDAPTEPMATVAMLAPLELATFAGPGTLPRPLDAAQLPVAAPEQEMLESRIAGWQEALSGAGGPQSLRWEEGSQVFEAKLVREEVTDSTELGEARVEVTRSVNGRRERTELHFRQLAFSH